MSQVKAELTSVMDGSFVLSPNTLIELKDSLSKNDYYISSIIKRINNNPFVIYKRFREKSLIQGGVYDNCYGVGLRGLGDLILFINAVKKGLINGDLDKSDVTKLFCILEYSPVALRAEKRVAFIESAIMNKEIERVNERAIH